MFVCVVVTEPWISHVTNKHVQMCIVYICGSQYLSELCPDNEAHLLCRQRMQHLHDRSLS